MVLRIIVGGKRPPRRPYDEDDMQDLRDVIYDAVEKWGNDELAQIDTKRMALHALKLSILDLSQEGETDGYYSPRMRRSRACSHGRGLCEGVADGDESTAVITAAGFDN